MEGLDFNDELFLDSIFPPGLEDKIEMILTYVPEAEYFDFEDLALFHIP